MAKLLGTEKINGVIERYWLHTTDGGKDVITVETVQDVEPVFDHVEREAERRYKDLHYVADIPTTLISEICKNQAKVWGMKPREVFAELIANKTDRAQKVWRLLTQGRDYRKLQAKHYGR